MSGTQQIYNFDSLNDNVDRIFMCMSERYFFKKRFGMGAGCGLDDFKRLEILDRINTDKNCDLYKIEDCLKEEINKLTISYDCSPEFGCPTCN